MKLIDKIKKHFEPTIRLFAVYHVADEKYLPDVAELGFDVGDTNLPVAVESTPELAYRRVQELVLKDNYDHYKVWSEIHGFDELGLFSESWEAYKAAVEMPIHYVVAIVKCNAAFVAGSVRRAMGL